MAQFLEGLDFGAITTGVIAIGGVSAAIWTGFKAGLKQIKGEAKEEPATKIAGGIIMGSMEVMMLTERLRDAAEAMRDNTDAQKETRHLLERMLDRRTLR